MSSLPDPAVRLDQVAMTYRTEGRSVTALADISLAVAPGEFISLIGPSGCGKSTILRIVADILKPTAGQVSVCGLSPQEARLDHRYSFVFQEPVLLPWRNVRDNVGLPLELAGVRAETRHSRVDELLNIVRLEGFGEQMPNRLSGGMRMRASLARALTQNPPVLLMDEPFGALDEITRLQMNRELLRVWDETSAAVIFVTHSIQEAVFLSDRVVVLSSRPGKIAQIVSVDLARPRDDALLANDDNFQALCRRVRRALYDA
jgi:NitT/TauT family transport system ATP-binding protein